MRAKNDQDRQNFDGLTNMANATSAWGIEIGQAGLKAIKLQFAEAAQQVLAVAFDYIPHAKLLSQPDAVPDELIKQALDTFLARNQVAGDLVAISLPGQTALAKFIQLPPIESKRIKEIVKYEARQQIPFALEEVIWDYQPLGVRTEEGGFLLDAEVGLFAMKREQVQHHLQPFLNKKIEVELIQIAPLALYNFFCYDRIGVRLGQQRVNPEDYSVIVDMGCDNTTLIVTNSKKMWIRNMPVGGNHFTRALTKEMKLTFVKAEHLKCNATKAPDPRAVFQALRPVFNDYLAEIQRSIGFFSSVNRSAKIGRVVGVGNGFRLAGLQKFLQQNLQYEVERIDAFNGLVGDQVLNAPLFQDNLLTFCVPYGLAIQALQLTEIHTTLLPPEIVSERKIRRKKPWAAATAAALLAGLATSAAGYGSVWNSVSEARFKAAEDDASKIESEANAFKSKYTGETSKNGSLKAAGNKLVSSINSREYWMEIYKAIDECLPRDIGIQMDETDISKLNRISVNKITCEKCDDLGSWFKYCSKQAKSYMTEEDTKTGPAGKGYIFKISGVHYHDDKTSLEGWGSSYVKSTLLANLQSWFVNAGQKKTPQEASPNDTPVRLIGISHAALVTSTTPKDMVYFPHGKKNISLDLGPAGDATNLRTRRGLRVKRSDGSTLEDPANQPANQSTKLLIDGEKEGAAGTVVRVRQTAFDLEFVWKPTPVKDRKTPSVEPSKSNNPSAVPTPKSVPNAQAPGGPSPTGAPKS